MKKAIFFYAMLVLAGQLKLQAQEKDKQILTPGSFSTVSLGVNGEVIIRQGNEHKVIVEGDRETLEETDIYIKGDRLVITDKNNWRWGSRKKIKVYATLTDFSGARVSGSGTIRSEGILSGDEVRITISGSGKIDLHLEADAISSAISGSGKILLTGRADKLAVSISGSGSCRAEDLQVADADVAISGSGSAWINASREIVSRISGSGSVYYKGEPQRINNHASGSGKLRKM